MFFAQLACFSFIISVESQPRQDASSVADESADVPDEKNPEECVVPLTSMAFLHHIIV